MQIVPSIYTAVPRRKKKVAFSEEKVNIARLFHLQYDMQI